LGPTIQRATPHSEKQPTDPTPLSWRQQLSTASPARGAANHGSLPDTTRLWSRRFSFGQLRTNSHRAIPTGIGTRIVTPRGTLPLPKDCRHEPLHEVAGDRG